MALKRVLLLQCLYLLFTLPNSMQQEFLKLGDIYQRYLKGDNTEETTTGKGKPNQSPCNPDNSMHSTEDILALIDYIYKTQSLDVELKESYHEDATQTRDSLLKDVTYFRDWIENRPVHLLHILEELSEIRRFWISPNTQRIAEEIRQNPKLEQDFEAKLNKTTSLIDTLKKYKSICDLNHGQDQDQKGNFASRNLKLHKIQKRNTDDSYYCSSLEDLHNEIKEKLTKRIALLKEDIQNDLIDSNDRYTKRIQTLKAKLKDSSLKKFGLTMYDVLNLQDEYHHFSRDFLNIDVNQETYSIQDLGIQIDRKLLALERAVQRYGQYCNNCKRKCEICGHESCECNFRGIQTVNNEPDSKNPTIVDALLKIKYNKIRKDVQRDLIKQFSELEEVLQNMEDIENFLEKLNPLQEEIARATKEEKQALEDLKLVLSPSSITDLFDLVKGSQKLLDTIEEALKATDFCKNNPPNHDDTII